MFGKIIVLLNTHVHPLHFFGESLTARFVCVICFLMLWGVYMMPNDILEKLILDKFKLKAELTLLHKGYEI